jgi:hypothetical protein
MMVARDMVGGPARRGGVLACRPGRPASVVSCEPRPRLGERASRHLRDLTTASATCGRSRTPAEGHSVMSTSPFWRSATTASNKAAQAAISLLVPPARNAVRSRPLGEAEPHGAEAADGATGGWICAAARSMEVKERGQAPAERWSRSSGDRKAAACEGFPGSASDQHSTRPHGPRAGAAAGSFGR